ncbi:MAG: hypothetical protein BWX50_00681 [Euryarchaeota archaeon ADurb.Bin009]|nr:MAG: hypothetical protein BWX50_00681 [Euryarchaeota archaeon ADurb.Bin009]
MQHRGPPWRAIVIRLRAVIWFASDHSCFFKGVDPVIRLTKMPVPIAAPQVPWLPQNPPGTMPALARACRTSGPFLPGSPRWLQYAAMRLAGTRKWCSGPCILTAGQRIRIQATASGSSRSVAMQNSSMRSSASRLWHRSQTKCPASQAAVVLRISPQTAQGRSRGSSLYRISRPQMRHPALCSMS